MRAVTFTVHPIIFSLSLLLLLRSACLTPSPTPSLIMIPGSRSLMQSIDLRDHDFFFFGQKKRDRTSGDGGSDLEWGSEEKGGRDRDEDVIIIGDWMVMRGTCYIFT